MASGWNGHATVIAPRAAVTRERRRDDGREREAVSLPNVVERDVGRMMDLGEKSAKKVASAMVLKQNLVLFLETGVSGVSGVIALQLTTRAMERT